MATVQSSRFGELLKHHRSAAGLTQEELAERARLSVQSISTLERGTRHTPHRDTVRRLVKALELQGEEQSRFEAAARRLGSSNGDGRSADGSPPIGRFLGALPDGPMVARNEELDRIVFAADAVEGGAGRLILLAGEAGVGKTRLAQEVMVLARDRRFLVGTGRCYEAQTVALYPFREALDSVYAAASSSVQAHVPKRSPYLERLLPVPAARAAPAVAGGREEGPALEEQYQVFEEITGFLKAVAGERPLAILLDDLQWADQMSLDLLSHLARHTRGDCILLLGTYRDAELAKEHPLQRMVRDLAREGLVERVPLRRLALEETAALVAATVGALEGAEDFVEFVHRRSKGNPFYVEKMVQGLGGRYRLVRQIGAGGMGRVFEAVDTRSGQRVAAKIMLARTEADPKGLQRFEQEGAVLAQLEHPNIVRVHGTFLEEHASCIVMELVEGQSLGEILREDGEGTHKGLPLQRIRGGTHEGMPLRRVKGLTEQVVEALECAHSRAIIHRDIKPDNIMVSEGDLVKVTDFGIARMLRPVEALTTMTSTGMTVGTPLYMAPEQIQSKKVDARSDIYSLGCVLYELVTGRPPFVGDDPFAVGLQHVLEAPRPPRELNGELPEDWEALILRMLAKDPAERFQTAAALRAAVAALSDEGAEDAVAMPPSGAAGEDQEKPAEARGMRWWRWPALAGVAGMVLVALAAVLLVRGSGSSGANHAGFVALKPVAVWKGASLPPVHFQSPDAVALDEPHGSMYVADAKRNAIFKLSLSGRPLGQCGCVGRGGLQLNGPAGVAVDGQGNVYVADTGNDRIVKFSPKGAWMATWGRTGSGPGQFRHPRGIAVDRQGNIIVADTGNDRIQRLSPRGVLTGSWGQTGSGPGQFSSPNGVAVDRNGAIYVADGNNLSIVKLSPRGAPLDRFSTSGDGCHCPGTFDGGIGIFAPSSVAVDARGDVYAADAFDGLIRRFTPDGRASTGLNGLSGVVKGALRQRLRFLQGLAVDARGTIYAADAGAGQVDRFSADGRLLVEWSVGGAAIIPFIQPVSVRIGPRGTVYVMDNANGNTGSERIFTLSDADRGLPQWGVPLLATHHMTVAINSRAVDSTGEMFVTDSAGDRVMAFSARNRQVPLWIVRGFSAPAGIAVHEQKGEEWIYVADTLHDRIAKLSRSGHILASFRTYDVSGYYDPVSVVVDAQGYLYIAAANVGNYQSAHGPLNRIHKMSPKGLPITDWTVNGKGVAINGRMLLGLDRQGNIYVLQQDFAHILKVSPSGKLLGQWGTYGSGPGQFANPGSIAVDRQGDIYVADTDNNRIQKFGPLG